MKINKKVLHIRS